MDRILKDRPETAELIKGSEDFSLVSHFLFGGSFGDPLIIVPLLRGSSRTTGL